MKCEKRNEKKVKNYCWWKKWLQNKVVFFARYNRVWINGMSVLSAQEIKKFGLHWKRRIKKINKKKTRKFQVNYLHCEDLNISQIIYFLSFYVLLKIFSLVEMFFRFVASYFHTVCSFLFFALYTKFLCKLLLWWIYYVGEWNEWASEWQSSLWQKKKPNLFMKDNTKIDLFNVIVRNLFGNMII